MYTANVDIGGTFTDGFFTDGVAIKTVKVLTTPHDLTECFMQCITGAAEAYQRDLEAFLRDTSTIRLSTTVGTNLLVERSGPKVGLMVTEGFESNLYGDSGSPLILDRYVPRGLVEGVAEMVDEDGRVVVAPDKEAVLAAVRHLLHEGARMIVVSLRRAASNPANEWTVRELVRERYPVHYLRSVPLQLGSEIASGSDDHGRTNTSVLNAYLHGDMARALYRAEDRLRDAGYMHPLLVVHGNGGCARVAKTTAIQTLSSGPAAAVHGAWAVAEQLGLSRVVCADMGGTSLDIAVILDGRLSVDLRPTVEGIPLSIPMVGVESVGAGGGSIVRAVDGRLAVGPESAGSTPGPVCYGRGGQRPTVTDANVVLGYIHPDFFLGGKIRLDPDRARQAFERWIAGPLALSVAEAALEVRRETALKMASEIADRIRNLGHPPSEYALFSYGGAGPLHACEVADQLGFREVYAFPFGSVFSAFGINTTDVVHWYTKPVGQSTGKVSWDALRQTVKQLRTQAIRDMRAEGFSEDGIVFQLQLTVVYPRATGQGSKHPVLVNWTSFPQEPLELWADQDVVVDAVALSARGSVPHWMPPIRPRGPLEPARPTGERIVWWDPGEARPTAIFHRDGLAVGQRIAGPAIVEGGDTNYVVPGGWTMEVEDHGYFHFVRN
ncbi:MAG: hydantoinase/oxoprolinase family protein [Firmicutes bacterium]|nr:hydantoinase/oxoprolinase family protein [Bacillota bacterium]